MAPGEVAVGRAGGGTRARAKEGRKRVVTSTLLYRSCSGGSLPVLGLCRGEAGGRAEGRVGWSGWGCCGSAISRAARGGGGGGGDDDGG